MEDKTFYSDSQTGHLSEWGAAIAQICEEKGISKEAMVAVLESALSAAYKKESNRKGHIVRAEFQEESGGAKFWEIYHVIKKEERDWSKEIPVKEFDKKIIDKSRKIKKWEEENFEEREQKEEKLLFFRPEREMLLPDAKKLLPKIKEDDYLAIPVKTPEDFGRIAAQTAKQVVLQKIKEIEKGIIYEEYYNKIGEVLPGVVQRIEGVQVYVDLGKTIALLPRKEQVIGERYDQGQRLKVYIMKVEFESKTSMVVVSRSHPGLVEGLFRLEVPEIFSGSVDVVKVVREPGQRAKIAVMSKEEGVDPVGSCIGQRGTRVQAVTDELRGERIDIIEYGEDPTTFLERALSPAKIKKIEIQKGEIRRAKVYVDRDQQSIAIGRGGQNVRLASRLTGHEIDIETWEEEKEGQGEKEKKKEEKKEKVKKVKGKKKRGEEEKKKEKTKKDKPEKRAAKKQEKK
jgi:N utilization substance protein A